MLAYNEATGEVDYYPILAVWSHEDNVIQFLTIDGEQIVTTPNHPFKTGTGAWLPAGELQVGDTIYTAHGSTGMVEAISFVYQPQPMYNLTVATAHTYFVGDGQWVVHNKCRWLDGASPSTRGIGTDYAQRAKNFYSVLNAQGISTGNVTVAVSEAYVNGRWVEVVSLNGGAGFEAARAIANVVERNGGVFIQATGNMHAEEFLYRAYRANGIQAIGVSHFDGPCPSCRRFFESVQFFDVYWLDTFQ